MTHRMIGRTVAAVTVVVSLGSAGVAGQAGRWSPPRLADGQPDIQGHWISDAVGAAHSVEDGRDPDADLIQGRVGEENPVVIVAPPDNRIPYRPETVARREQLLRDIFTPTRVEHVDPHVRALLDGVPRNGYVPGGMQILQVVGAIPTHVCQCDSADAGWCEADSAARCGEAHANDTDSRFRDGGGRMRDETHHAARLLLRRRSAR